MSEIVLDDLTKSFGKVKAIDHVSLAINDGEFLTLLGPSGCGKTTTLRTIAGLEFPTSGRIFVDGRDVIPVPPADRNLAMVFQSYALYPHMTVRDNIAFPLENQRLPKREIARRVNEVAGLLQIEELLDRKPKQLSGGQRQRIALGRAIVRTPVAFLMDEPLSNLDAALRVHMRTELTRLQKRLGSTTVYVTHDQAEAMSMSDRIAVMKEGRIQQVGTPEEVYDRPRNSFVAEFIGSPAINLFPARIGAAEGTVWADFPAIGGTGRFAGGDGKPERPLVDGETLLAGVRPEHLEIARAAQGEDWLEGRIYLVELEGRDSIVSVSLGDRLFKVIAASDFRAAVDATVFIRFRRVHLFERGGGEAVATWQARPNDRGGPSILR